jgi:hypothetical protein
MYVYLLHTHVCMLVNINGDGIAGDCIAGVRLRVNVYLSHLASACQLC